MICVKKIGCWKNSTGNEDLFTGVPSPGFSTSVKAASVVVSFYEVLHVVNLPCLSRDLKTACWKYAVLDSSDIAQKND